MTARHELAAARQFTDATTPATHAAALATLRGSLLAAQDRADRAEAAVERVRAVCSEAERANRWSYRFGGVKAPAIVGVEDVLRALDGEA